MNHPVTIQALYSQDCVDRLPHLESARQCMALTLPWFLPPNGWTPSQKLPTNFQSTGAFGLQNKVGKYLVALYDPTNPWFETRPTPQILYSPLVSDEYKQNLWHALFMQDCTISATMDSCNYKKTRLVSAGFRAAKVTTLISLIGTGDSLERINPDYSITVFRRDQYSIERDSSGRAVRMIVVEKIHPFELPEDKRRALELPFDFYDKPYKDQKVDLYTMARYNWETRLWVITQEAMGKTLGESQETYNPFISTVYQPVPGCNYGYGLVAANQGDLWTHDQLARYGIDWAGACSTMRPVIDENSDISPEDLAAPSGKPMYGKVNAGVVQDIGFLKVDKLQDFSAVERISEAVVQRLSRAFMLEQTAIRNSERTTATEVGVTVREVQSSDAHVYPSIAEQQQKPTVDRFRFQMERDGILPAMGDDVETVIVTGTAALANQQRAAALAEYAQFVLALGPAAQEVLDPAIVATAYARYRRIYEPGMVKTPQQIAEGRQQAVQTQLGLEAGKQAIQTGGAIIENAATQAA